MVFENKVVFLTGCNRGIGRALLKQLKSKRVKKIYAAARDVNAIEDFEDPLVETIALDITNYRQIEEATKIATDTDILINNAGRLTLGNPFSIAQEAMKEDMDVNYYGTMEMMRAFIPILETKKDPIIANVVSIAAFVNFPFQGGYCASKAALFSLTQGARIALKKKGIRVHSINPGPIDTDMGKGMDIEKTSADDTAKGIIKGIEDKTPDIFPDAIGNNMFELWKDNYVLLENMSSEFTQMFEEQQC